MRLMLMLGGLVLALTTASPAFADGGLTATDSIVAVQVGSPTVTPAASVGAPVNANAPVCVASACDSGSAAQSGSSGATASTAGPSGQSAAPTAQQSAGVVQVGSATVAPAAAASAPVNADAPICVASRCKSSGSNQGTGAATATSSGQSTSGSGSATSNRSVGVVQIGSVDASPAASASAPVNGNLPICVLSDCGAGGTTQGTNGGEPAPGSTTTGGTSTGTGTSALGALEAAPRRGGVSAVGGNAPAQAAGVLQKPKPRSDATGGVLGTGAKRLPVLNAVATKPQLPFTGLSLLAGTVIGASLVLVGGITRRLTGERGFRLG